MATLQRLAPGLAAVWMMACAHTPLRGPDHGGHRWIEAGSEHFALRTDLSPRQARTALLDFEQTYSVLERVAFPTLRLREQGKGRKIDLVIFRDSDDFLAIAPTGASGYFTPALNNDVEHTPTIVMYGELSVEARRRFQHELTHRFLSARVHLGPPWLEEGLAEYYSTLRGDRSFLYLGELPVNKLLVTEIRSYIGLPDRWLEYRIRPGELPSFGEVLHADSETFHAPEREVNFYGAAWLLVHMLHHSIHGYRPRFEAYLRDLAAGRPHEEAWQAHFGDIPEERLEREYFDYVRRIWVPFRLAYFPPQRHAVSREVRRLRAAEVYLLWARIRPWDSRENILRAGTDLRQAAALEPDDPEVRYWRSLYNRRWRRFGDAEEDLRQALSRRPEEPRYWHALAELLYRQDDVSGGRGRASRVEDAVQHLARLAQSPSAFNFLARYYSERGQIEEGLPYLRRALEIEPGCWECVDTRVLVEGAQRSQPQEASPPASGAPIPQTH